MKNKITERFLKNKRKRERRYRFIIAQCERGIQAVKEAQMRRVIKKLIPAHGLSNDELNNKIEQEIFVDNANSYRKALAANHNPIKLTAAQNHTKIIDFGLKKEWFSHLLSESSLTTRVLKLTVYVEKNNVS